MRRVSTNPFVLISLGRLPLAQVGAAGSQAVPAGGVRLSADREVNALAGIPFPSVSVSLGGRLACSGLGKAAFPTCHRVFAASRFVVSEHGSLTSPKSRTI